MRIVIAPDKFKSCLTAREAADAIQEGLAKVLPGAEFECVPLADGGEGTAEVFATALGGSLIEADAHDAIGRRIRARYGWMPDRSEAVVEMSAASGLWRLADGELDPWHASTRGTGELMMAAARRGARRVIVGLGGSATNDAGCGMAAALGFRFLDADGGEVDPVPARFSSISTIVPPANPIEVEVVALSDVDNPLLGSRGATRVFGPQKGVANVLELDAVMAGFADLVSSQLHCDHRDVPGAGAAGGLGFGLLSFCGAEIRPGFDELSREFNLPEIVRRAALVVTAEGSLDPQTLSGKGPGGIARLANREGTPVVAIGGALHHEDQLGELFDACIALADRPMTLGDSMRDARVLLVRAAERLGRLIRLSRNL